MLRNRIFWLLWTLLVVPMATAQDDADKAPEQDPPAKSEAAPAAAKSEAAPITAEEKEQFEKAFTDWKDVRKELGQLKEEYPKAKADRRKAIEARHKELIERVESLLPVLQKLVPIAEKLHAADPKNPLTSEFLVSSCIAAYENDDFENVSRLSKLLLEGGFDNPRMYDVAGLSAFFTMQLADAEKYLKLASENGSRDPRVEQCLAQAKTYKKYWAKEQSVRESEAKADDLPRVLLKTTQGDITIELFENEAPNTVANFISLVEKKFYDGLTFHRVLPGFMAQGGCPEGTGTGGPGYLIPDECRREGFRRHFRGSLSMAKAAAPDTGGSQFFLNFTPTEHLDGKHTVFGRVVEGLDVLAVLKRVNPERPGGDTPDRITEATVLRKRDHDYKPKTLPDVRR